MTIKNSSGYLAEVRSKTGIDALVCITYDLGVSGAHAGAEFYLGVSTSSRQVVIPSHRQATFQEELLATGKAAVGFTSGRSKEIDFLISKLKEAYGEDAIVEIRVLKPADQQGANLANGTAR